MQYDATSTVLQASADTASMRVGLVAEGTRVTILRFGEVPLSHRAKVYCADTGDFGWLSITSSGSALICRVVPMLCPNGHPLSVFLETGLGVCDGCNTPVNPKSNGMDCRACNFYLCR